MDFSIYNYKFVGHGYIAPSKQEAGTMMVDVGGNLCPGVLDHHHLTVNATTPGKFALSTSGLLLVSTHLLPDSIQTFVTHIAPDFDAWLTIWLIQYFHEHNCFPPHFEKVVDYVTELDTGKLNIKRNNTRTPVAVAAAIPYIYIDLDAQERDLAILMRGLELVDYIFKRLETLPETNKEVNLPYFIEAGCTFEKELQLVDRDLEFYDMDINDGAYTDKTRVKLHNIQTGSNEYVDALFWKKVPRCAMHKHWARSDSRAPGGCGYILTFIPIEQKTGESSTGTENSRCTGKRNRVIISVNPNMQYNLFGLAPELERNELLKEAEVYPENPEMTRAGEMLAKGLRRRFPDAWCTNHDPWYDGRSDGFTIVDSPHRFSLLSIEEIAQTVLSFTIPKVAAFKGRMVFPFSFHLDNGNIGFDFICNKLGKSPMLRECGFEEFGIHPEAFYPYIRDYMNLDGFNSRNKNINCRIYRINENLNFQYIIMFSYGTGFIIKDFSIAVQAAEAFCKRYGMDEVLDFNYKNAFGTDEAAAYLSGLTKELPLHVSVDTGFVYSCISVNDMFMNSLEICKILYQVCNLKSYLSKSYSCFQDDMEYSAASASIYRLNINNRIDYGFGKSGGCILFQANINDNDEVKRQHDEFMVRFMTVDFISFLLSLHQRTFLINLSRRLAVYAGKRSSISMVRKLRYFIMEFMAKGWFSQISRNELNVEIYKRWRVIFENSILFDEVNVQVKSYEDYLAAERNRKIGLISSIFVPVSIFNIFFSINMLGRAQGGELIRNMPWYGSLLAMLVLFLAMLGYLTFGSGRRKL